MRAPGLDGRHVLVTRAVTDAASWVAQLATRGVSVSAMPCVTHERIADPDVQRRLVDAIQRAHCLIITSVRGAQCVAAATTTLPLALQVGAVGPATAGAIRRLFARHAYVAEGGTSRSLGQELAAQWGERAASRHVVVVGPEGGRDDADTVLAASGAHVTRVDVYRTVPTPPAARRRDLAREGMTDVLLASPTAVTGLVNQATMDQATRLYSIGPTTSAAVVAAGLRVAGEARRPGLDGLVAAMVREMP